MKDGHETCFYQRQVFQQSSRLQGGKRDESNNIDGSESDQILKSPTLPHQVSTKRSDADAAAPVSGLFPNTLFTSLLLSLYSSDGFISDGLSKCPSRRTNAEQLNQRQGKHWSQPQTETLSKPAPWVAGECHPTKQFNYSRWSAECVDYAGIDCQLAWTLRIPPKTVSLDSREGQHSGISIQCRHSYLSSGSFRFSSIIEGFSRSVDCCW
ncbi:hypothetical protein BDW62DRAFT_167754 [Aspergillus aurantiobrunneus]